MNTRDPKIVALLFNECINNQDLEGLSRLMSNDHAFIDSEGTVHQPKEVMVKGWREFFKSYPNYRNTFHRMESRDNLVVITGFAFWSEKQPHHSALWTATIVDDLVREWRVYSDTEENRKQLNLV